MQACRNCNRVRMVAGGFTAVLLMIAASGSADDPKPTAEESSAAARRLEQMRGRAARATVRIISNGSSSKSAETIPEVQLEEKPLFRYSDPPREFHDGALWIWTANGRPVALGKTEDYRGAKDGPLWITCFASLHSGLIESDWTKGPRWASTDPGVSFQQIKGFEQPEKTEAGRLRQFKTLSERFAVTLERHDTGAANADTQEMRRLPRNLHRYQIPDQNVIDAVMFGWTSNGTNPSAVLVIEQRSLKDKHEWHYAMAPITTDKVDLKLDGKLVQSRDYTRSVIGPTIRVLFEPNEMPID